MFSTSGFCVLCTLQLSFACGTHFEMCIGDLFVFCSLVCVCVCVAHYEM